MSNTAATPSGNPQSAIRDPQYLAPLYHLASLAARTDDPHTALAGSLVERPDVATVEREHDVDAELAQGRDRLVSGVTIDMGHVKTVGNMRCRLVG